MADGRDGEQSTGGANDATHQASASPSRRYTPRQGQFLAYIFWYTKLNRRPPAEADMAWYFGISPESAHLMIVRLEQQGLISRVPRQPRSIRLLVAREELPDLE